MSKFQLWSRDEYGQGSILMTSENIDEVVKRAKEEVTSINVANALTADDRERNWEAYFPIISSAKSKKTQYVYGGIIPHATSPIYEVSKNGINERKISEIPFAVVQIYLGNIATKRGEEKDWFATDVARKKIIESLDHPELNDKTMLFIKKVE